MEQTQEINSIVSDLLKKYTDSIKDSGHSASGDLVKTASYICKFDGRYFEVIFNLEEYWKYLENGTKPHFPPTDAIEEWIRVKRIVPRTSGRVVPTTKQLAFLIARGISKNGTQPTKLLQKTIDSNDDLINQLCDELIKQLEEQIENETI